MENRKARMSLEGTGRDRFGLRVPPYDVFVVNTRSETAKQRQARNAKTELDISDAFS